MKYEERERIVEGLPYEARIGYVAFCVDRCLKEARRHAAASKQLDKLPLLTEAVDMLWARAEKGVEPDPERIEAIRTHLKEYEVDDPDGENVIYKSDITLVNAAGELLGGLLLLEDPDALDADEIVDALEGPENAVCAIYVAWEEAGDAEVGVIDAALKRLEEWGNKPFSREVFAGIPEWNRSEVKAKYAQGRITGTDVNRED